MPFGLGDFYLKETVPSGWFVSRKNKNPHTFGKFFRFTWDQTYAIFRNLKYVEFKKNIKYRNKLRKFYREVSKGKQRTPEPYSYPVENFTKIA